MVDALASGASGRKAVEVRVLSWAPQSSKKAQHCWVFCVFTGFFSRNCPTSCSTKRLRLVAASAGRASASAQTCRFPRCDHRTDFPSDPGLEDGENEQDTGKAEGRTTSDGAYRAGERGQGEVRPGHPRARATDCCPSRPQRRSRADHEGGSVVAHLWCQFLVAVAGRRGFTHTQETQEMRGEVSHALEKASLRITTT